MAATAAGTRVHRYLRLQLESIPLLSPVTRLLWPESTAGTTNEPAAAQRGLFLGVILLAVLLGSPQFFGKLVLLFSVLILVGHLAKMFGEHVREGNQMSPQSPTPADPVSTLLPAAASGSTKRQEDPVVQMEKVLAASIETLVAPEIESPSSALQEPPQPAAEQVAEQAPPAAPGPVLFVCTKCQFSRNRFVNSENRDDDLADLEDLAPGDQSMSLDQLNTEEGREKLRRERSDRREREGERTGKAFYEQILVEIHERKLEDRITVAPTKCLSTCYHSNSIAFSCPGRYSYQFGDLDHHTAGPDVAAFAELYLTAPEGYTKTRHRPDQLKDSLLARIPPRILPISTNEKDE